MIETFEMYFLLFISYAIIGWCMEVILKFIQYKRFINRGFLIGPYCPIYGFGALLITLLLQKYQDDLVALFLFSMVVCSILEYLTSLIMEKIFHARWWDYSNKKFNINGRICLNTMIPFGLLGVVLMKVTNPLLLSIYDKLGDYVNIISFILLIIYTVDSIISLTILFSIRKENKVLDKDNTEEMSRKVYERIRKLGWGQRRLLNAFPNIHHISKIIKETGVVINNKIKEKIKVKKGINK